MIHADHPAFVDVQRLAAGNVSFSRLGPRRVRIAVKAAMWMLAGLLTSAYCWRPGVFESVVVNLGVVLPEPMNVFDDPVRKYCLYVLGAGTVLGARFAVSFDEPFLFLILLLLVAFDSLFLKHHFLVGSIIRMAIWKYSLSRMMTFVIDPVLIALDDVAVYLAAVGVVQELSRLFALWYYYVLTGITSLPLMPKAFFSAKRRVVEILMALPLLAACILFLLGELKQPTSYVTISCFKMNYRKYGSHFAAVTMPNSVAPVHWRKPPIEALTTPFAWSLWAYFFVMRFVDISYLFDKADSFLLIFGNVGDQKLWYLMDACLGPALKVLFRCMSFVCLVDAAFGPATVAVCMVFAQTIKGLALIALSGNMPGLRGALIHLDALADFLSEAIKMFVVLGVFGTSNGVIAFFWLDVVESLATVGAGYYTNYDHLDPFTRLGTLMRTFLIFFPFWYAYNHHYIRRVAGRVLSFPRIYHYHTMRTVAPELFPLHIVGDDRQFATPDESQFRPYDIKRAYVYGGAEGWTFRGQQEFKSLSDDDGEFVEKCRRYAPKVTRMVNKAASIDKDKQQATRRVARWLPHSVVGGIQRIFGVPRQRPVVSADRPMGTKSRFTMEERSRENEEESDVRRGLRHRALRMQFRRPRDELPSPFINSTEKFVYPWNLPWNSWYGREEEKSDSGSPMHRRPSPTLSSDTASLIGKFDSLAPYVEEVYVGPHRLGYRSRHASEFRDVTGTRFRSIRRQRLEGEVQIALDARKRRGSPHRIRRKESQDERKVRFHVPPRRSESVPPHFHSEDDIWQELADIPSEDEEGWLEYMMQQREAAAWKRREGIRTPTSTPERKRSISSALAEALEVPRSLVTAVTGVSLLWSPRPGGVERTPTSSSPGSFSEEKFRLRLDKKIRLNREFVRTLPLRLASITAANVPVTRRDWPIEDSNDEISDASIPDDHAAERSGDDSDDKVSVSSISKVHTEDGGNDAE